jgi:hypothetical protein
MRLRPRPGTDGPPFGYLRQRVSGERAFGGAVALFVLGTAVTAYVNDYAVLGTVLLVIGVIGLILVATKWIPVLHRLPLVGAIPPPEVRFHLERESERMAFDMHPSAPARVLLCAGIPEGRRREITRVLVNAYVAGATSIYRAYQDGEPYKEGGVRMTGPDAPYWSVSGLTIPLGAFLIFFKVTIPEPGEYEVILKLQSPDFHSRKDHVYRDKLIARAKSPS